MRHSEDKQKMFLLHSAQCIPIEGLDKRNVTGVSSGKPKVKHSEEEQKIENKIFLLHYVLCNPIESSDKRNVTGVSSGKPSSCL